MISFYPAPFGYVLLPEPDFGRPGRDHRRPDERLVRPAKKKGGRRGA